jgi:hypothetical protein
MLRDFFSVISTKRGSIFYVDTVGDNENASSSHGDKADEEEKTHRNETEAAELLALDELIPKTKAKMLAANQSFLGDSFIPVSKYKEMRTK